MCIPNRWDQIYCFPVLTLVLSTNLVLTQPVLKRSSCYGEQDLVLSHDILELLLPCKCDYLLMNRHPSIFNCITLFSLILSVVILFPSSMSHRTRQVRSDDALSRCGKGQGSSSKRKLKCAFKENVQIP